MWKRVKSARTMAPRTCFPVTLRGKKPNNGCFVGSAIVFGFERVHWQAQRQLLSTRDYSLGRLQRLLLLCHSTIFTLRQTSVFLSPWERQRVPMNRPASRLSTDFEDSESRHSKSTVTNISRILIHLTGHVKQHSDTSYSTY
jgi:hypothetical protein